MKLLGVEFAPLWLPVERRLQTAAVAIHMGFFFPLSAIATAAMLYLFFYTRLAVSWLTAIARLISILISML